MALRLSKALGSIRTARRRYAYADGSEDNNCMSRHNKAIKAVRIRSLDSPNGGVLRILRAACVCPLVLR